MTVGHKHRHIEVRRGSLLYRVLRKPLIHSTDLSKVEPSPYPYGLCEEHTRGRTTCWYLSSLSILHRWTGLTLEVKD